MSAQDTPLIDIVNVSVSYGQTEVLKNISLAVNSNERWALIGRNGAGKSTMVKTIAAILTQYRGRLNVAGKDIRKYHSKERANYIAYVPQSPAMTIPFTVYNYVMLGRYAKQGLFSIACRKDHKAVREALAMCDVSAMSNRPVTSLSGGEMQRVLLAGAIAQQAPVILLDEPTTFLDPAHEHLFYEALERFYIKHTLTALMVTHDINTALTRCTHICSLLNGTIDFAGTTAEFMQKCPAVLEKLYGIPFRPFYSNDKSITLYRALENAG